MSATMLRPDVLGAQSPQIMSVPPAVDTSLGREAVEFCAAHGLHLDVWEAAILEAMLGRRADGRWSAFEAAMIVPRQNGKGTVLEGRELVGLFLLSEFIVHSAHMFDTSLEAFRRLLFLIEDSPELDKRVKRVSRSHGEEGIELVGGARIRFRTRTKGGGRGFSADCLVLDEGMVLPESFMGALLPILSAKSQDGNPQVIYAASAVDQLVHEDGVTLARLRERGRAGDDPSLAFFEFTADESGELRPETAGALLDDPDAWAAANPALGIRISAEHVEHERRALGDREFAVERLGVGDWPSTDRNPQTLIERELWTSLCDPLSVLPDPVSFAIDVAPDRSWCSIAAAGYRPDGLVHVEVPERKRGTGWVVDWLAANEVYAVTCDGASPAASLLVALEAAGVVVATVTAKEYAQACGHLFDVIDQRRLRHLGSAELANAVTGAATRPLGDAWAWSRKSSATDISPLVAATLAVWGAHQPPAKAGGWRAV